MRERSEDTERKIKRRISKDNQNNVQNEKNNDLPVSSNSTAGKVYSIQHYVIKFASDL